MAVSRLLPLSQQAGDRPRRRRIGRPRIQLLEHLDHGPVRDPLAVGEAAAAHNRRRRADVREELRGESRLANARGAQDGDQLAGAVVAHAREEIGQGAALPLTAHHGVPDQPARLRRQHGTKPPRGDRMGLPLHDQRLDRFRLRRLPDERKGVFADQDLSGLGGLLKPGRDVHGVSGRKPLPGARDHLAGLDSDPASHLEAGQRVSHLARGPHRSKRIVLVQHRHAEHRHHGVADELLHRAAMALDDPPASARSTRASSARRASGSSDSPSAVEPVTSQKTTVTILRCSPRLGGDVAGAPHSGQNRNASPATWPHA